MQKHVAHLSTQLQVVQSSKDQYEAKLKDAFMRGLSALNNETMPMLSPSQTTTKLDEVHTVPLTKLPLPLQHMLGDYSEYNTPGQTPNHTIKQKSTHTKVKTSKVEIKRGIEVVRYKK